MSSKPCASLQYADYLKYPKTYSEPSHEDWLQEIKALRQRNEELDAENVRLNEGWHEANVQILAQQLAIENMREALKDICTLSGDPKERKYDLIWELSNKTLSIQPSTAELAKHDETVRVEEREECAEVCNGYAFGYENHMEGADHDDFIRFEFAKDAAIVMREAIRQRKNK